MAFLKKAYLLKICQIVNTFYWEKLSFRRESNEMSDRGGLTGTTYEMLDGKVSKEQVKKQRI